MMIEQLSLFGASSTQQHFSSTLWGMLEFIPSGNDNTKCRHCLLSRSDEDCMQAPCDSGERMDGESGYFTIHQMPD